VDWKIVTNVEDLIKPIQDLQKKGYNYIQMHSSSPDEMEFIEQFAEKALPHLKKEEEMEKEETTTTIARH
jgi:coenzyme F420-dependent glucose-6-phosphate dehydrogenase